MRSSALMAAGTVVSRALGFVRAAVISAALGLGLTGTTFAVANTVPNILYILLAGGVLNSVFVPQLVRAMKDEDTGRAYTDRLLTLTLLVLAVLAALATAAAPLIIPLYAADNWAAADTAVAVAFAFWCLPQIFFYGLYTVLGQILNARGSFGPMMWAPIVNNDNGRAIEAADASAFDNETTRRLFDFFDQMLEEELVTPFPGRDAQIDHYLAMALGGASMTIDTSTAVTTINSVLEGTADPSDFGLDLDTLPEIDINLDAAALPGLDAPGQGQVGGGVWYISNTVPDEQIAAAWDFLKFVNEPVQQELWHTQGGYLPSRTDVAEDQAIQDFWADTRPGRWLSRAYELAENLAPDFPGPLIGPYRQVRNAINDALQGMMLDGQNPDAVIRRADEAITAALERYNDVRF